MDFNITTEQRLTRAMANSALTFTMLEKWATTQYRMDNNPCEQLRMWLKRKEVNLRVDYMETEVPVSPGKVIEWIGDKTVPMLVVHVVKSAGFCLAVELFLVDNTRLNRPAKDCASLPMPSKCQHCGKVDEGVELDDETYQDIDMHGVECLPEVDQFLYEGGVLCHECYCKEGGC